MKRKTKGFGDQNHRAARSSRRMREKKPWVWNGQGELGVRICPKRTVGHKGRKISGPSIRDYKRHVGVDQTMVRGDRRGGIPKIEGDQRRPN